MKLNNTVLFYIADPAFTKQEKAIKQNQVNGGVYEIRDSNLFE